MRTESITANTIDTAAEEILKVLKEKTDTPRTVSSRDNVYYFDGWDGLGASAVLRAIAQRLATTSADGKRALAMLQFDQVIHIDCSMWESRRALQRAVAEQLNLPNNVMELFNSQDEEDDFRGVAQGSRAEVQQVAREMHHHIQNRRLLVIFHNGSNEEIDLARLCGFPLSGYSTSKVLWTFQGRFRLIPRREVDKTMKSERTTTDAFISAVSDRSEEQLPPKLWSYLVQKEASEVAEACKINSGIDRHRRTQVEECFMYMLGLFCRGRHSVDYDWATHGANYWICDGIIQQPGQGHKEADADGDDDGSWRAANALQSEMVLDVDYHQYLPSSQLARFIESKPSWISPNYGFNHIPTETVPNGDIFQHYASKLCVLKLSRCTFDFQSPPFLCCCGLRFLWLDHCQSTRTSTNGTGKEEDVRRCFERLWVLDVRHTDCDQILSAQMLALMTQLRELNVIGAKGGWDMGQLQGQLPNIRRLRVKNSTVNCSCSENDLFSEMSKMEHLEFSGNETSMTCLFGPGVSSNASCLETVMVDGCDGLEQISFSGCTELKNLLLGGRIRRIRTLDISGTAVKTVDLSATTIPYLDELYLLDCEKLCAILWPPKDRMKEEGLGKLCIDTTSPAHGAQYREEKPKRCTNTSTATSANTTATSVAPATTPHGNQPMQSREFEWHVSVRDARLLASLLPVYSDSRKAYVEVSSPGLTIVAGGSKDKGIRSRCSGEQQVVVYADTTVDHLQQASEGNCDDTLGIMWIWPCPDVPDLPSKSCYLHIQDHQTATNLLSGSEESRTITVPEFVIDCAKILHVHDSLSMTIFPSCTYKYLGSEWHMLDWCRIERCPKLDCVFTSGEKSGGGFSYRLATFWASQLFKARYMWKKSEPSGFYRTFPYLRFLHLSCCPRLIHVLPLSYETFKPNSFTLQFGHSLSQLETLEITWCGNLREVFPLDTRAKDYVEQQSHPVILYLPSLKYIRLLELPRLECICGVRMSAPNLESIKIRGCWSLTCLPDVSASNKIVECDCEKEWWDRLESDDGSQVEHYKPIHSQYYKKTMLRGTVLR